jgi:basic membrane protein A
MVSDGEVLLGGWYGSMEDGRLYLEEQTGLPVDLVENVAVGQVAQRTFEDLAADGYDVLISIATYDADIAAVAPNHPDTIFLQSCDATILDNMAQYCTAVEQARYVDGVLAASLSETGKIGYVIGFEIPFVLKPLNAFVRGAQSVNPDVTVEVAVTNSWFDPTLERQAAESLVNNGADVLTYDLSSSAVPEVASENGIPFVGYGYDDAATQAPDAWAGGSLYNWGPIWVEQIEAIQAGTWETTYAYGGFEAGYLDYTELPDTVPEDVKSLVGTTIDQLTSGEVDPLAGPINDKSGSVAIAEGETADVATCCDWVADGVVGDVGG